MGKLKVDLRSYLLPLILILITLTVANMVLVNAIRHHYYDMLHRQSSHYALNYAQSMTKAVQATQTINELLEEKLHIASKTLALQGDYTHDISLMELAESLGVDEVYLYNQEGVIIDTNQGHYLGWEAYPDHPVFNFMTSDSPYHIEDIRRDTESDNLFKYAYIRSGDGFFQLGIAAQRVEGFLSAFDSDKILQEMAELGQIHAICYLDDNFIVQSSSNPNLIHSELQPQDKSLTPAKNGIYSAIDILNDEEILQVYVPVFVAGEKAGTLVVTQSLVETRRAIAQMSTLSTIVVLILFGALFYSFYNTHQQKQQLQTMAYYHNLTGLPNRRYLEKVLEEKLRQNGTNSALLLIHLKNFNTINHVLGFHYGDRVLKELARNLHHAFQKHYTLFHFSGSRLALFVEDYEGREELRQVNDRIRDILRHSQFSDGLPQQVNVQLGIVEIEERYQNPAQIFTNASLALFHTTKQQNHYGFFSSEMEEQLQREILIEHELRRSITEEDTNTLYLEYQPIVDLETGQISGFEALARMSSPKLGFVSPLEFINIAERQQLIIPLGEWVCRSACRFMQKLKREGYGDVKISINVSVIELLHRDFFAKIQTILAEYEVDPHNLTLEITESVIIYNFEEINAVFQKLRKLGIKIAIDDFGTGYSSFARIEELNVDVIKIDKHFIDKIGEKAQSKLILNSLISMAHGLDLLVVAEGVETQEQRIYLTQHECDLMQGYLFSRSLREELALDKLNNL